MKLDETDRRILYELDKDSRQSLGRIAKRVRCSKQKLHYRIERLVREGVITGFITSIDTAKLGYHIYPVWIELSGLSLERKRDFLDYLVGHDRVHWVASCGGRYDIAIAIAAKNVTDFNRTFRGILREHHGSIKNYAVGLDYEFHRYNRTFRLRGRERKELFVIGEDVHVELDEADRRLLALLSRAARAGTNELAGKAGVSPNTVRAKMRRMERDGIIKAYTISIQEREAGIQRQDMFISLHNLSEIREKELEGFMRENECVTYMLRVIGKWDMYLTLDTYSKDEFQAFLVDLRSRFADIIKDFDMADVVEDLKFTYLPMIGKK